MRLRDGRSLVVFGALFLLMSCAPKPVIVVNTAYDFSKVRRISVEPFEGPGGAAATDEFVKELVGNGLEVTDARHSGDVILTGAVTDYKPNNQLMIFLGGNNPIVTVSAQPTAEEAALNVHRSQVASIMATVAIQARLLDASTHHIVWADNYSYEGLDLPAAMNSAIAFLKQSLARPLPQLNGRTPS